jgi:nucleoside-diphosphate-sugar epimerase
MVNSIKYILITGSEGYIGSVLVDKLKKNGYNVRCIDSGFFIKNSIGKPSSSYYLIKKDIRLINKNDLKNVDAIIHLAALSNDPMGELNPSLTKNININATIRLAKLAKEMEVKRFLFSSSCSVYGITKTKIVNERSKTNPQTYYAKYKLIAEQKLKRLASKNFFVGILRNSTAYGFSPRFRNDLVVNNMVSSALSEKEIKIMSDGTPWRPLIDVRDLAQIFIEFLKTNSVKLNGKIVNIGFPGGNYQINDIAKTINKYMPKCKITYTGEHGSDTRSYKVDFKLFKKYFPNLKQEWPLSKSVKDLINKLKKNKKIIYSDKFSRLSTIKKHLKTKTLNPDLYWNR